MGSNVEPVWAIDTEHEAGRIVLRIIGDLDLETAPRLASHTEPILEAGTGGLVIDLSRVTFIDSSGLSALIRLTQRMGAANRPFQIIKPPPLVGKVFEITGLNQILPLTSG
jgi:anti-sigma B factor antagonist